MKVRVLGSYGSRFRGHNTSCLLIDDKVLLDAGAVSSTLSIEEQVAIDHVLLTHAHLDHMVDLAFMADNVLTLRMTPLQVWAPAPVLESVKEYLFNDRIWPDFTKLPSPESPAVRLMPLKEDMENAVHSLSVRWVRMNHPVFSAGYCVREGGRTVLFTGDTAATEEIWNLSGCTNLQALFVECSFPSRLAELADATGHLTPLSLQRELKKFGRFDVPVKILHIKPQFMEEIVAELGAIEDFQIQILQDGDEFTL